MKSVLNRLLWILLFVAGDALAGEGFPMYPEDPFGTHDDVATTPGRSATQAGNDPCIPRGVHGERWTLVDVIDQALCHNPQTRQAWANAKQQASQFGSAESAYLPSLTFNMPLSRSQNTAGGGISNGVPVNGGGGVKNTQYTRVVPQLSVNYLLFDFGGRAARVETARQALEAANWQHAATIQTVLYSALQAYYQLFAARASLEAAEQTVKSMQVAYDSAAYRFQVGSAALGDKLQAQTTLAQAKVNRRTAEGNAKAALGAIANAMGLNPHHSLEFEPPNLAAPDPEREKDVESLLDIARDARPDLAAAEAQVKAGQANVLAMRSQGMPQLSLVGNYSYLDSINSTAISSWAVGVQVSVPLFTGFNNSYQVRAAEEQVEAQAASRDQLEQAITQSVWQAYYTLAATKDNLHNTEELLDSAKEAERVALGRYREGVGNIVEVTNAENNLANARYSYVQAHYNWRIGKAQLAQALGRLDAGDVEAVEGTRQNGVIE
jgi:TolC family type I secretion outer membrane protein